MNYIEDLDYFLDNTAVSDNTTNVVSPQLRQIAVAKKDTPQRRKEEAAKQEAWYKANGYVKTRTGWVKPRPQAQLTQQRVKPKPVYEYEQKVGQAIAEQEQQAKANEEAAAVLGGLFAPVMPSRWIGSVSDPSTHSVGDAIANLYNTNNRGFFNINQNTRDWYDTHPGEGEVLNLFGDFATPFVTGKALHVLRKAAGSAAEVLGQYRLATPNYLYGGFPFPIFKKINPVGAVTGTDIAKAAEHATMVDPAVEKMKQEIAGRTQEWLADVTDSRAHVMQQYPGISYGMLRRYPDLVDEVSVLLQPAHMDIPSGTPKAQWLEELMQRKDAVGSLPDIRIGEVLGYDFSGSTAPTFLNNVNDLMQSRIAAGRHPGIMMRNTEHPYGALNNYGQVNWGTNGEISGHFVPTDGGYKLPFGDRVYTQDEILRWKTPEIVKKQIDNRLDKVYETMKIPDAERAYTKIDPNKRKILVPSWQFIFDRGGRLGR